MKTRITWMWTGWLLMSALAVALAGLPSARAADSTGDAESVLCSCRTKKNPSWCGLKTMDWEEVEWSHVAHRPPRGWTADLLAAVCRSHADPACLCDGIGYFRGVVQRAAGDDERVP